MWSKKEDKKQDKVQLGDKNLPTHLQKYLETPLLYQLSVTSSMHLWNANLEINYIT